MRNKTIFILSLMVIAAMLAGCAPALTAQAQTTQPAMPAENRTISVTGSGKAFLDPDIAYIYVGVHTENEDAKEAVNQNNAQTQKVVDALKSLKIDAKDIQTTSFSIYPQQQYDNQGKVTGTRYVVDNTVYVTLRNISNLGDVLDEAITAGANSINGIQFDVSDRTEALTQARKEALDNAKNQAQELAKAAGLELGTITSINTATSGYPVPMYDGRGGGAVAADVASTVPVNPGQLVISVDVNVVYAIR